jgi:hypothetical protein
MLLNKSSVVYRGVTSVWPVSASYWYWPVSILVSIVFGGKFLRIGGNPLYHLSSRRGAESLALNTLKGGQCPPFEGKRWFTPRFSYQNEPTEFSLGIVMVNTEKIPTDTDQKYRIGIQLGGAHIKM